MSKRGQNEGSIYKRKDGRWVGAINLGYQNGKLKRKTFYGDTRGEVNNKLTAALNDQQKGLPIIVERQTVAQFLDKWLEDCVKPSLRPKTYSSYSQLVCIHLKPDLGKIQISKLMPQQVQSFMRLKLASGLSPRTVQYLRAVLRRALGQALKWSLVARNVAALVDGPRSQRQEITPLTPEQARVFLKACKGDRLEALYSVALAMGLRRGEALGLRWQDVDLKARTLRVNVALQRIDGKLQLVEPKTDRSRRALSMPKSIAAALRAHRVRQLEEKIAAGKKWQESGLIFTSTIGTPLEPRNAVRRFNTILEKAKLPHQRFHDLRHACASLLLAQNVPARTVMDILGHSVISTTMDIYAHVMPAMKSEAADLMDSILTAKK